MRYQALLFSFLSVAFSCQVHAASPSTQPLSASVQVISLDSRKPVTAAKIAWETSDQIKGAGETDARGEYAITAIPANSKWLTVRVTQPGMTPLIAFWNTTNPDTAESSAIPPFLFLLEPAKSISGKLVDSAGKPIAGALVNLRVIKQYPGTQQEVDPRHGDTRTDAAGRFTFGGIPADPDHLELAACDHMHIAQEFFQNEEFTPRAKLWDGSAQLTLPIGTPVRVRVVKPDGSPASGADVFMGTEHNVSNCIPAEKCDADGRVLFGCKPEFSSLLTATLDHFGPAQAPLVVGDKPVEITLHLSGPTPRMLQILGADGKPVAGAHIAITAWHRLQTLTANLTSDNDGRVYWNSGPPDEVTAEIYSDNYLAKEFTWTAEPITRLSLSRPTVITTLVVDSQTDKPIDNFTVRAGATWHSGERCVWQSVDWESENRIAKSPGKSVLQLNSPAYRYRLRVQAPEYLPQDSDDFDPAAIAAPLQFHLQRGTPITGTILTFENQPASADVYLFTPDENWSLSNDHLMQGTENSFPHAIASADGRFTFPPQNQPFALLILSDHGTLTIKNDELASQNGIVHLHPWSKITGTIQVHGKPGANLVISGWADAVKLGDDKETLFRQFFLRTDSEGKFQVDRIAPGHIAFGREISNRSPGRGWNIMLGSADVQAGQTVNLTFGKGATVAGQLRIPSAKSWMVRQARLQPANRPADKFSNNIEIADDGRFHADGLSPGQYILRIALHEFPPDNECGWGKLVAQYDTTVNLPPNLATFDIGTLTPTQLADADLNVGDTAPDFSITTLDGKSHRLSDFKGKTVLLDFWAGWCAPCVAEIPTMQKLAAAHAADPNFLILGLSQDENVDDLRLIAKRGGITWPQAWIGVDSPTVRAYGASAIPANFLVASDGRILASNLHGGALESAVRAALASPSP